MQAKRKRADSVHVRQDAEVPLSMDVIYTCRRVFLAFYLVDRSSRYD